MERASHKAGAIPALDPAWFQRAAEHQARMTMPTGALGRLLDLGRQLCAIQQSLQPRTEPAAVLVMAADHGIAAEGVSAYPQQVTGQMVQNFLRGGAAINVLAHRQGARVLVVDMGIRNPPHPCPPPPVGGGKGGGKGQGGEPQAEFVTQFSIARGTANFLKGPAMSPEQVIQALKAGRQMVTDFLVPHGTRVVALGEMGIANTSSASALTAALTGQPVATVTGRGTGLDDAGFRRKVTMIEQALNLHFPERAAVAVGSGLNSQTVIAPEAALSAVGGFEIAGLAGAALEAASRRMVVVLDGFISAVAGLIAARLEPAARDYFVAGHRSVEAGHQAVLEALDLVPLFDLGMRLGEGSGAALALNFIHSAADIMRDMATFESAGVSDR
jgi:nicotinate-nucleotide--dimethylbenzimidazole phosphoribosyltransferase